MSQTSKYAKYIHATFNGSMEATDYNSHVSTFNITIVFALTSINSFPSLATGKTAVYEIKRPFEFTHCKGRNIFKSLQYK